MVSTDRASMAWSARFELGRQPVRDALGRELDRRQRVLDLVRQAARHLAPGFGTLRRDDLGDVVEHHQPRLLRHGRRRAPAGSASRARARSAVRRRPATGRARRPRGSQPATRSARPPRWAKPSQAGHFVEAPAAVGRQRQAQDARRPRVHGVDAAVAVEHDHAGRQVVEDGLQVGARAFELGHAALHQRARLGQLRRSCRRTSASARRARRARRTRAWASGRPAPPGARPRRASAAAARAGCPAPPRAAARRTRPGSAPASACRCTCGAAPRAPARAAGTRGRPPAPPAHWRPGCGGSSCVTSRKRSCSPSAKLLLGISASARTRAWLAPGAAVVVQALELARHPRAARLAQQRRRRAVGRQRRATRCRPRAGSARWRRRSRHRAPTAARAAARAPAAAPARPSSPRRSAASSVLAPSSFTCASIVSRPRFSPASSAPSTFTSNQLSMLRETNWYDTV